MDPLLSAPDAASPTAAHRAEGGHLPALDGLRAVAVIGVLAFHSGWSWARGGFLGVSLFFTLSGFLITRLLLVERSRTGGNDLGRFWSRRARRLLPAAFAGVALALAVGAVVGDRVTTTSLRGDALATLGYVANWRFVIDGRSYAELFSAASPLQHMWSLAIEEQIYLALPLLVLVLARRRTRWLALGMTLLATASVALGAVLADGDVDRAYYGTDTRAAELLVGALRAMALQRWPRRPGRWVQWLAAPSALAGVLVTWSVVTGIHASLFEGVLLMHALLVGVLLWAAHGPGPLTRLLSAGPLTWLGTRSYGVYVYHWPLFILLTADRTGLDGWALHAVRWGVVLALAEVSFRLLEWPVRIGRVLSPALARLGAGLVVAALAVVAFVVPATAPAPLVDFAAAADRLSSPSASVPSSSDASRGDADPASLATVAIYGDSTALLTGSGLVQWAEATGRWRPVAGVTSPGCPLTPGGTRHLGDQELDVASGCSPVAAWSQQLTRTSPDVVVIEAGNFDLLPWRPQGAKGYLEPTDPAVVPVLRKSIADATDLLLLHARRVVWITSPPLVGAEPNLRRAFDTWNSLIRDVAADHAGRVAVVDLAGHLADGRLDDRSLRPDGTHFTEATSLAIASEWLGDAVASAAGLEPVR
jgi:peptidoglycan/LPS O-acetylase OafA/YrhL